MMYDVLATKIINTFIDTFKWTSCTFKTKMQIHVLINFNQMETKWDKLSHTDIKLDAYKLST